MPEYICNVPLVSQLLQFCVPLAEVVCSKLCIENDKHIIRGLTRRILVITFDDQRLTPANYSNLLRKTINIFNNICNSAFFLFSTFA